MSASALDDDDGDCVLRRSNHLIYVICPSRFASAKKERYDFSSVLTSTIRDCQIWIVDSDGYRSHIARHRYLYPQTLVVCKIQQSKRFTNLSLQIPRSKNESHS